jgi:hypothetical protein
LYGVIKPFDETMPSEQSLNCASMHPQRDVWMYA